MDRERGGHRGHRRRHAERAGRPAPERRTLGLLTDFIAFLERLPPVPLYALISTLAAVENVFPPVPADVAVALGALLSGRGIMNPWLVFAFTWIANVGSGAAVYFLARKHGLAVFRGVLGRRILSDTTIAHIEEQYRRHGVYGIYVSRLLPVWRGVVMPFAGISNVPPARALIPLALASATYYGALIWAITKVGTNLDDVLLMVQRVNSVLLGIAGGLIVLIVVIVWLARRRKRPPPSPPI